jgi:hypothetical protein
LSDFRRVIVASAFAAASIPGARFRGLEAFGSSPTIGIKGRPGQIGAIWICWVFMGPVDVRLPFVISDNTFAPDLFWP